MKKMKKQLAVAITAALLAFPLSSAIALATPYYPVVVATTITTAEAIVAAAEAVVTAYEAAPITTLSEVATAEGLKAAAETAVAAVNDVDANIAFELRIINRAIAIVTAKTVLQAAAAEAAVAAYEAAPITTLSEVATAEGLKAAAETAVAAVVDVNIKTAQELRITNRAAAIVTAKTLLEAEAAVVAYEATPITTLAEVTAAEGLKAAVDTAVAAVGDVTARTALELRVTNRTATIAAARITVTPVVDDNDNTIISSTWFRDLIGKLQLALTFDPARKCELNHRQALAKLAEAQKLMKAGNPEGAQNCINQYTDKIAKAQAFLDQVKDPTSETAKTLETALVNVNSNNVVVLGNLIDKLPPQAAQKLALNAVRSMEKAVTKIQKEEAKVALETTPATPVETPVVDSKISKKQAKEALESFKKSLNQNGKVHIEDQGEDRKYNGDKNVVKQSKPEHENVEMEQYSHQVIQSQSSQTQSITQHKTAPTVTRKTKDQGTRTENEKNKDGDKEDNQRGNKYINR